MSAPVHIHQAGMGRNHGMIAALSMAILSGRSLRLAGLLNDNPRPRAGLGPGGYTTAMAAAEISGGETNAEIGAEVIEFTPGDARPGDYSFDVSLLKPNSAPISTLLETVLLPLASTDSQSSVFMNGGTHVLGGLTSDEIAHVLVPNWRFLGLDIRYTEVAPGFFPNGNGEAEAIIEPCQGIRPLRAEEPFQPERVGIQILTAGLPTHLAEQALEGARDRLKLHRMTAETRIRRARGGVGMALLIWAECKGLRIGFSALGHRGGRPEAVAISAVEALISFLQSGAGVPSYLAAHLLTTLACAQGVSRLTVDHNNPTLRAAIQAVEALQPGSVRLNQPRPNIPLEIRIDGLGLH